MDKIQEKKAEFGQNMDHQDFFQSQEWRKFQEAFGRRTHLIENDNFCASIIEHKLPIVGKYFYVPRGPIFSCHSGLDPESKLGSSEKMLKQVQHDIKEIVDLAKKKNAGWIRVEPRDSRLLEEIRSNWRVTKAPYDVQPKEIFVIDISKPEQQLLSEMKSKTRYNINLAKKKGVSVVCISGCHSEFISESRSAIEMLKQVQHDNSYYIKMFLKLIKEMARRQGIVPHPDAYYEKMFATFPKDMLKLYVAEYNGNVIAANLMLFYGNTATYLHGASSDVDRNVMAPFLLHWQAILDAKERGFKFYDFGGVKIWKNTEMDRKIQKWEGITKFKMGFSMDAEPVVFPGTYDIIVNPRQYALYKGLQKAKMILKKIRR